MKCTLMHKRIAVSDIELDDATGFIQKINIVYAQEHLPIGVPVCQGVADGAALNEWWTDRSIPASRSRIREVLEALDISSTKMLLVRCYGLSLSDQYWICPEGSELTWDKINFFENDFSDDIGDVLFGTNKKLNGLDFSSSDNTSDGNQKKRWKIINGRRCFVNKDTELVPAWRIMQTLKKSNSTSMYQHFVNCCEALGVKDVKVYPVQDICQWLKQKTCTFLFYPVNTR